MADQERTRKNRTRDLAFKIAKATIKAILVYLLYFVLSPYILPIASFVPGLVGTIEIFVIVYIVLMILGDLTERTVYQCFVNTARALFVVGYIVFSFGDGMFSTSFENLLLTVDLTLFYAIVALLSVLGLAKTVLQAIYFMSERAETGLKP